LAVQEIMANHLTDLEIDLYRRGDGDPGNRQTTAAHLAVCRPCLGRVLNSDHSAVAVNALTQALFPSADEEPFHLSTAEMQSYVAGSSAEADRVICESHIGICERCDQELRQRRTAQASQPAVHSIRTSVKSAFLTPARLAAALALIGLLTLAALLWWQQSSRPTGRESAGAPLSNGTPETPAPGQPAPLAATSPQPGNVPVTSNPRVVASLKDNSREISLDNEGKLSGLDGFDESSQKMVKAALTGEGLAKPKVLDELSSPPITLLGGPPSETAFQLIGPMGKVITDQRPVLSWTELRGATSYVVSVFDANFNRVATSTQLSKPNWQVEAPLPRGQTYSWEVAATKDGKLITAPLAPAPRAQFHLIEADKLNALARLKQQTPPSHLALGLMYARLGLMSEAEAEFRKLVKENPDSAAAKRLLRTVQTWR
jgi:hypothetical protein